MHPLRRLGLVAVVAAAGTLVAPAAAWAEIGDPGQTPTNDEYNHAADFVAASGGGGGAATPTPCELGSAYPETAATSAHYEWNSYFEEDGTYSIYLNCVADGQNVPSGDRSQGTRDDWVWPDSSLWRVVWSRTGIVPRDPTELVAEVLARLRPEDAGIRTDPGGDRPTMVGIPTWLWLDGDAYRPQQISETDGPTIGGVPLLAVTINAVPKPDSLVTWTMGDGGSVACPNGGLPPGSCTYEYTRSSAGEGVDGTTGLPAFTVTAGYTYTGTYEVRVMGRVIDSGSLGDIERTATTTLAVNEAQAINTRPGG
jgi:hypothetical protein